MEQKIKDKMYDALIMKYQAQMLEAEASLLVYFNSPVGIGEHPQHIEEMDKLVEKIANAKDKLETFQEFHKYNIR
jgi:methylaspartate ammonia-lyase